MDGYILVSLNDMLEQIGEDSTQTILSDFSCPLNHDVEYFLWRKAIPFSKQGIAKTHLVLCSYKEIPRIVGYFTLANKYFEISAVSKVLNSKNRARLKKFVAYRNEGTKTYFIPAPLIAQLGKNFTDGLNRLITGDELLKIACDQIRKAQHIIGGKFIYLECEDKPQLVEFYEENGFCDFHHRNLDRDEREDTGADYYVQMLKYLK